MMVNMKGKLDFNKVINDEICPDAKYELLKDNKLF